MSAASIDAFGKDRDLGSPSYRPEDFPGWESFHLPASELDTCEGRLAFRGGIAETALKVCGPTSILHEEPSRLLVRMAGRFAMRRGSHASARRTWCAGMKWGAGAGCCRPTRCCTCTPDRVRLHGLDGWRLLARFPIDRLTAAAVTCTGEADFLRRIREQRGLHTERPSAAGLRRPTAGPRRSLSRPTGSWALHTGIRR